MGFGKNPYVSKAQETELKAESAGGGGGEVRAWLEAAHLWERAAAKEQPGKRRLEYEEAAVVARAKADAPTADGGSRASAGHLRLVPGVPTVRSE